MRRIIGIFLILFLVMCFHDVLAGQTQIKGVVNVNTASKANLLLVPGLGAVKVEAIVAQRNKAPFKTLEDLLIVRGIGEKTLKKISPYLVTHGMTTIKKEE